MEKFKKAVPYLLIALLTAWFSYKFFVERKTSKEQLMTLDWDQLDSTSGSKPLETPASIKKEVQDVTHMREHNTLTKEDEDQFAAFDRMEKAWLASAESIIGVNHYGRYLEMRENNDKEKMMAYKEYHDYLRLKFGDKFTYNISEDQSVREKEINQRYLKELLTLIGEKKFQAYLNARDKINEENRRNNKEFIQIEF
jgi:uncharacterized short protein YbdD (DUF466 family)